MSTIKAHFSFLEVMFEIPYFYAISRHKDKDGDGKLNFEE
jgi:hypothetical protein